MSDRPQTLTLPLLPTRSYYSLLVKRTQMMKPSILRTFIMLVLYAVLFLSWKKAI